jgi:hypothetical protein
MSLARRKRDRILAAQTISAATAPVRGVAAAPAASPPRAAGANASPADRAAAQIALRLTHDLRRLKEIRSIDKKIEAKREMLPEYRAWLEGVLEADAGLGTGLTAEVLPTCMVWLIDIGEYARALDLADFMLRHNAPMPTRYKRDAATIVAEEVADAAAKVQNAGTAFPLNVLSHANDLTADLDLHDQVRAKLLKAIGVEQLRISERMVAEDSGPSLEATLATLREAQRLHERVGVKDRIKRADKLLAALPAPEPNTSGTAA